MESCSAAPIPVPLTWTTLDGPHAFKANLCGSSGDLLAALDLGHDPGIAVSTCIEQPRNDQVPWLVHFFLRGATVDHSTVLKEIRDSRAPQIPVAVGFVLLDYDRSRSLYYCGVQLSVALHQPAGDRGDLSRIVAYFAKHAGMLRNPSSGWIPVGT